MPMPTPYAYIVSYDLTLPTNKYKPLFEELQRSHRWFHYIANTWIVLRTDTLVELQPKLTALIFKNDRMLIMPAKGPAQGWLPKDAWEWIEQFVPKEW